MSERRFVIRDDIHCEYSDGFGTLDEALNRLKELAAIPWEEEPNRAPCRSWRTCGRRYEVVECDVSSTSSTAVRSVSGLLIDWAGARWVDDLEGFGRRSESE